MATTEPNCLTSLLGMFALETLATGDEEACENKARDLTLKEINTDGELFSSVLNVHQ